MTQTQVNASNIIKQLRSLADPKTRAGMARFGIDTKRALGVAVPALRSMAKRIGKNQTLAGELWASGIHEARLLAGFIADPAAATDELLEGWVLDFDSWDVCDLVCSNYIDRTRFAWRKAAAWARRDEEFVRRAGFVLMAALAVHDKAADDERFIRFFPLIKRYATDERNFAKKAVNWALRQIGKRNGYLKTRALALAREIGTIDSKSARWIASDAIRELEKRVLPRSRKK